MAGAAGSGPTEQGIRELLRPWALAAAGSGRPGLVEEFSVPASSERADIATVGADLHAYEIKSERDSLKRLPRQVRAFSRLFGRCSLVVAEGHAEAAEEMLPDWWGLLVVGDQQLPVVEHRRQAQENPGLEVELLVRVLWKAEAAALLEARGLRTAGLGRLALCSMLVGLCGAGELQQEVGRALLEREGWLSASGAPRLSWRAAC